MGFLTLHSRKQNYFLLLLSGIGSPPPSHCHHCCFVQKKPSSVFAFVLSIDGRRAACSAAAAVADFLPAPSWASSPHSVNHVFCHPSSVLPQNPHFSPPSVSFPLRCFLDTICDPVAMSCWIIALFLVSWGCILIGSCYHRGMMFTVPTKPRGWARLLWWITAPWLSQPSGTWDACSGVQQLVST